MTALAQPRHGVRTGRSTRVPHGLPADRMAMAAAHRALCDLKLAYQHALAEMPGPRADWLRHQVRRAQEPADLWPLRTAVFDGVPAPDESRARDLQALRGGAVNVALAGKAAASA